MDTFFEQIIAVKKNGKALAAIIGIWLAAFLVCFIVAATVLRTLPTLLFKRKSQRNFWLRTVDYIRVSRHFPRYRIGDYAERIPVIDGKHLIFQCERELLAFPGFLRPCKQFSVVNRYTVNRLSF